MTDVTSTLHLTVQHPRPDLAVATVTGDMDLHTADTLRHEASKILERQCPRLILDLSHVGFCDSTGLSALISLWHAAQKAGGALGLANVPDRLMRMLTLTGVDAVLPVHATAAEALTTMTDSPSTSTGEHGSITRVFTDAGTREPTEVERTACDSTHHSPAKLS
ncbi:anti-sigma factor antagonist [Streptomyces sp. SID1328]|nr:STAS domain-containing protein [Streptomyces sp. SID1328]MYV41891.1 anti-sigma factor antagonist [Streptomyces sp. SID1328]